MNARELVNFLKLMYHTGCLSSYWKSRITEVVQKMGDKI
jgi:hypothetical protein